MLMDPNMYFLHNICKEFITLVGNYQNKNNLSKRHMLIHLLNSYNHLCIFRCIFHYYWNIHKDNIYFMTYNELLNRIFYRLSIQYYFKSRLHIPNNQEEEWLLHISFCFGKGSSFYIFYIYWCYLEHIPNNLVQFLECILQL